MCVRSMKTRCGSRRSAAPQHQPDGHVSARNRYIQETRATPSAVEGASPDRSELPGHLTWLLIARLWSPQTYFTDVTSGEPSRCCPRTGCALPEPAWRLEKTRRPDAPDLFPTRLRRSANSVLTPAITGRRRCRIREQSRRSPRHSS
jgi:hypothetical protein